jgi:hypothetical protein
MLEEVTILGNGPSRNDFEFNTSHEVWGCNAIYRDTNECDLVFACDMPVQKEIVESGYYNGNGVAFADIDPLPIEMLDMFTPDFQGPIISVKEDDSHFIIQGNDSRTDFLGLKNPHLITTYNEPNLRNLMTGMSALGYAMHLGVERINLIGFDGLEFEGEPSNIYEGSVNYPTKYTTEDAVLQVQRSQFIALLEWFYGKGSVYWKNPLDKEDEIKYNELPYYENSESWILGQGLESLIKL